MREPGCDTEVAELETGLDSWADMAVTVVSAVPLGLIVTLEEDAENV